MLSEGLCRSVWGYRSEDRVLWRRQALGVAVYGRRRGEDEALERRAARSLEQPLQRRDVEVGVGVETLAPARAHAGLSGQVVHDVDAREQLIEVEVEQVLLDVRERGMGGRRRHVEAL